MITSVYVTSTSLTYVEYTNKCSSAYSWTKHGVVIDYRFKDGFTYSEARSFDEPLTDFAQYANELLLQLNKKE